VLLLPAGPAFQLEKEIKNVITVLAKTFHYWTEHANPMPVPVPSADSASAKAAQGE
jgi:hypothetical protein